MLSEKAAKKWRIVTFTLAMLGVLEYSGALNPIVYFFASEKVWNFYTGFRGDSLACYFLTALFVSEALYVLVQPKKWKRWIYGDYAGYGGFAIILFFSLYLFYAQRNSCPVQIHISWKVQLTLAVLIWFMPPVLRKINKVSDYDKIDKGTHVTLAGYLFVGLSVTRFEAIFRCNLPGSFVELMLFLHGLILLSMVLLSASFWCYYFEYKKTKKPFLLRFMVYWAPFLYAGLK